MAEYIEREAAIAEMDVAFPAAPSSEFSKGVAVGLAMAKLAVCHLPAADVRPVVLCRECKHWETDWTPQGVSDGRHYCAPLDLFPSADWYCSDGEKREES